MGSQPEVYSFKELLSGQSKKASLEEIFPPEDIESEKVQYLRALADARLITLQGCNRGFNKKNRHIRRLQREKAEISLIIGEQLEEIRELRKALADKWAKQ